ncbi:dipeptide ABC superfamily ATP binding cassette transporter, membrane protein [Sulfobacillus acidophilus TPY]|uniref:ABC-type transporter, integral membrane subunit n=1 Tax=Sulfobacillus acidophilus (strain ATCC 700253 / DSM 10332 / NAL) TaxID=679936 RepID=G8TSE8_SULAD|nr:dipeptide ABC superfamily ATP binding cassette transporter, membrane protein [Sulfobacillus acidophilus TPY]AEW06640.1 ABC-type transporter, integral membrane subunit [Sulfobacillus acidophilus DSM 10332]
MSAIEKNPSVITDSRPSSRVWRRLTKNPLAVLGLVLVTALLLLAIWGPALAPYGPDATHFSEALAAPSSRHWLGTDDLGRDILSRILWGARGTLVAGLGIVLLGVIVGVPLGLVAGYHGGWVDDVIMRVVDAALAFPSLVLALAIEWLLGPSLVNAVIAIGVVTIPQFARITRGQVLTIREREYVDAAVALGVSPVRIMGRHILPNIMTPLIVIATLNLGTSILAVASLSFLGLGPPPPAPNWGAMLQEGSQYLNIAPWVSFFPGAAIFLAVLGFSSLGDGLRDVLDPTL